MCVSVPVNQTKICKCQIADGCPFFGSRRISGSQSLCFELVVSYFVPILSKTILLFSPVSVDGRNSSFRVPERQEGGVVDTAEVEVEPTRSQRSARVVVHPVRRVVPSVVFRNVLPSPKGLRRCVGTER